MTAAPGPALGDIAAEIRSKNAGPFWITIEAFMRDRTGYLVAADIITPERIASLYQAPVENIHIFRIADLHVVKVSFPRPVSQASLHDRDVHAGQQHVLLSREPLGGVDPPSPVATQAATGRCS